MKPQIEKQAYRLVCLRCDKNYCPYSDLYKCKSYKDGLEIIRILNVQGEIVRKAETKLRAMCN